MPNTNLQTIHQMGQAINEVVRQATGRDAVQNIDMDHVTVAQNQYYEEVTLSAGRVSFTDRVGNTPLEKCIVQIEPVQDLHGYDHPWVGGAGKNLFEGFPQDPGNALRYYSLNIGNGTFTMSTTTPLQSETSAANLFILPGQVATGANTAANGVSVGVPRTVISIDGYITIAYRNANEVDPSNYDIQIERGPTATAYEPYSNICPITGWTGANIHVSPTTDAQDGTTYSITFPDEAGTVYGGTLTVNEDGSGTLVVNRARIQPVTAISAYRGGQNQIIARLAEDAKIFENNTVSSVKCDKIETVNANWQYQNDANSIAVNSTGQVVLCIKGITTFNKMNQWLLNNAIEIVYELATPITYTITTEQISTIQGTNNIWADTGDIEVTYKDLRELY